MRWDLVRFDLRHGFPVALRVLRRELGTFGTLRSLFHFLWRSTVTKPFRTIGKPASAAEEFTRHQLKPLLLFDDVLRRDMRLSDERAIGVLRAVAGENGAAFVRAMAPHPSSSDWRAMDEATRRSTILGLFRRFENMEAAIVAVDDDHLGFDVQRCHFVELTNRLGRSDLAPLICEADRVFYDDPLVPIRLSREQTIARGEGKCTFRLHYQSGPKA